MVPIMLNLQLLHAVAAAAARYPATDPTPPALGSLAADWQPRLFPRGIGWNWYAPRIKSPTEALLTRLDHTPDFQLAEPDVERPRRVFVLTRSVPGDAPLFGQLEATHQRLRAERFGRAVWVVEYVERGVALAESSPAERPR